MCPARRLPRSLPPLSARIFRTALTETSTHSPPPDRSTAPRPPGLTKTGSRPFIVTRPAIFLKPHPIQSHHSAVILRSFLFRNSKQPPLSDGSSPCHTAAAAPPSFTKNSPHSATIPPSFTPPRRTATEPTPTKIPLNQPNDPGMSPYRRHRLTPPRSRDRTAATIQTKTALHNVQGFSLLSGLRHGKCGRRTTRGFDAGQTLKTRSPPQKNFCTKQLFCYFLALVRTAPTREPTRTNGAIRTNSHSKTWNAVPRTAVSGSPKFQSR